MLILKHRSLPMNFLEYSLQNDSDFLFKILLLFLTRWKHTKVASFREYLNARFDFLMEKQ